MRPPRDVNHHAPRVKPSGWASAANADPSPTAKHVRPKPKGNAPGRLTPEQRVELALALGDYL